MRAPFINTVILDPLLVRRGEVRSQTHLESSRVYTYIPEDLTVGEKEMLETAAGSSAPLTCAYRVGTGIYIDIRDSWRPPNKLLILSPFCLHNYPSSGSPYIRAEIPGIHGRPWLGFRVKCPVRSSRRFLTGSSVFEGQFFGGKTRGVVLPFTLKLSILRQKKSYGNSNISPCKNIIFKQKKPKSFKILL